jgi:hypothetical protein
MDFTCSGRNLPRTALAGSGHLDLKRIAEELILKVPGEKVS